MSDLTVRDVLLAFSLRYEGDYSKVFRAMKKKERIPDDLYQKAWQKTKSSFVTLMDDSFPPSLHYVNCPPFLLYYYGNFSLLSGDYLLTCIGTRNPTMYQNDMTYQLIVELEKKMNSQVVILSGMAKGLDRAAMLAAMDTHSPLIAVLGSGIDRPYPSQCQDIYDYCKTSQGLVLSEYPNDTPPIGEHFVFRNRILAALGDILYVGGGSEASGTSSTVRYATDLGKEIYALPCNITDNDLTNHLIADGAHSVLSSADLISGLKDAICIRKQKEKNS